LISETNSETLRAPPSPTDHERHFAAAMHICTIFFPLVAPVVGYAVSGKSRFLRSHSYQAIFETIILNVTLFVLGAASVVYTAITLWHYYQVHWEGFSIWPMLIRFAVGWILLAILEVVNTIYSILQATRALRGEWPRHEIRKMRG